MSNLNKTVEKTETDFKTLSKAISDGTKKLAQMKLSGQEGTKAYDDLARSLGNMKDAMGDARAAVNAYANDTKNLTDALDVFKTGTSVVGLYQSALVAMGKDGKDAEEVIKKLAAAETALNAIQKIQASLMNKSSGTYRLLSGAVKLFTGQVNAATIATKALKISLAALGIGVFMVVIESLANNWERISNAVLNFASNIPVIGKFADKLKEAKEDAIDLGEALDKKYSLQIELATLVDDSELAIKAADKAIEQAQQKLDDLKKGYESTGGVYEQEKKRFVKDLTDQLNELKDKKNEELETIEYYNKQVEKNNKKLEKVEQEHKDNLKKIYEKGGSDRDIQDAEIEEKERYTEKLERLNEKHISVVESALKTHQNTVKVIDQEISEVTESIVAKQKEFDAYEGKQSAVVVDRQNKILSAEVALAKAKKARLDIDKKLADARQKEIDNQANLLKYQIQLNEARNDEFKYSDKGRKAYANYYNYIFKNYEKDSDKYRQATIEKANYEKEFENKQKEIQKKAYQNVADSYENRIKILKAYGVEEKQLIDQEIELIKYQKDKNLITEEEYNVRYAELVAERRKLTESLYTESEKAAEEAKNRIDKELEDVWSMYDDIDEEAKKRYEQNKEYFLTITNETLNTVAGITDSIFELIDANIQRTIDAIQKSIDSIDSMLGKVDRNINRHINRLTGYYEALSDATGEEKQDLLAYIKDQEDALNHQYDLEKQLETEKYQREKQLRKEQARQQKVQLQNQLIQAIITGAANTLNGFNTQPFMPVGIAMGALAATLSAVQIGVIGANIGRIKYANGGLLSGPSHNDGGIPVGNTGVEVEGGEYVVNKKATAKYLPLLEQINDYGSSIKKFANGGEMNLTTGTDQTAALLSNINFNPVVAVTDINRENSRLSKVKVLSK